VKTGYEDVLFRVENGIGWITLNRPRAINALDHAMVGHIDARLADRAGRDAAGAVVLTGAGDRGLCAGGACARAGTSAPSTTMPAAAGERR